MARAAGQPHFCLATERLCGAPPPVGGTRVGQNVDHIDRLELAGDTDRQAFMAELVEYVEHPVLATIVGAILDEVIGPDMIALLRPQPDARADDFTLETPVAIDFARAMSQICRVR